MLIAEDLLLLLLDDATGKAVKSQELPAALGGALLVELALTGAVELEPKQGLFGSAKVRGDGGARPDDPLLAEALELVREKPRSPRSVVERLGKGAKDEVAERLVRRGLLERSDDKVLGLFPRTTWPAKDSTHEEQVRRRLVAVLTTRQQPDERTGALVALLSAIGHVHRAIEHPGMSNGEVRARAEQIADGDWAAKAVKDSVRAAATAATVATSAATST